jgi:F0F1-type ATP synthase epsilon subunit
MPENRSSFSLVVRDREDIVYEGRVSSLTSVNNKGQFDVLPNHANFISIIIDRLIIRDEENKEHDIKIDNGILRIKNNNVQVFLGVRRS